MAATADYITIPEASEIYKSKLNCNNSNKYDKIYRSILEKAKSGMFSPMQANNRALLISKQEFIDYVEGLTVNQYEQIRFELDSPLNNSCSTKSKESTLQLEELFTLIKLHRKLAIPPEETLRYIEKLLLLNLNQRGD